MEFQSLPSKVETTPHIAKFCFFSLSRLSVYVLALRDKNIDAHIEQREQFAHNVC